jgi:bisphosphoglycerate-independent phosphoglycerate mutase (AlkP superfamily)
MKKSNNDIDAYMEEVIDRFSKEPIVTKGPDTSSMPDPYAEGNWMGFETFKSTVESYVAMAPKAWRRGQAVFNIIDEILGVAREVQFVAGVDCFYNDNVIDDFIKTAYETYWERIKKLQTDE